MLCVDPANRTELSMFCHFNLLITVSSMFEWPQGAVVYLLIVLEVEDTCDVERSVRGLQACGCRVGSQVLVMLIPVYYGLWVHTIEAALHLFGSSHLVGEFSGALSWVNTVKHKSLKELMMWCSGSVCRSIHLFTNIWNMQFTQTVTWINE